MINYNQSQGQQGMMGANPMTFAPNMYYSPVSSMMGGMSATGMNPSLPQRQHSQSMQRMVELQQQNSIYGTGKGADRRIDAMIGSMQGVLSPQQIAAAQQGGEGRNFAMAMVNQNPMLNRMFGGYGNSAAVSMGARNMIDASAGLQGSKINMYGGGRDRVSAAIQLSNTVMSSVQNEQGGVRAEYGGTFENVGFAMQSLATGGSMQDIMSMKKKGKGTQVDPGAASKIKEYIKETERERERERV